MTGFAPFGGEKTNPSWEAVKLLPDGMNDIEIVKELLPVTFADAGKLVCEAIDRHAPHCVLCVGQAGGRSGITVERVAININDADIADNAGVTLCDVPCVPNGPAAYFSTLPIKEIVSAVRFAGIPAFISNSAGTYVCNHVLYHALHHSAVHQRAVQTVFIHVPFLPEQTVDKNGIASMSLAEIVKALEIAVSVCAQSLKS